MVLYTFLIRLGIQDDETRKAQWKKKNRLSPHATVKCLNIIFASGKSLNTRCSEFLLGTTQEVALETKRNRDLNSLLTSFV